MAAIRSGTGIVDAGVSFAFITAHSVQGFTGASVCATPNTKALPADPGYGQSWCLVSSSGLVLGLLNGFAVAEVHALDHLGEAVRAVQPAPVPLGGLGELEDHGERGLA